MLEVAAEETRRVLKRDATARWIFESSIHDIERLKKEINTVEQKMHKVIMESYLKENYYTYQQYYPKKREERRSFMWISLQA